MTQGSSGLSTPRIVALKGGTATPLFMFPGAPGTPDTFRELAALLGEHRPAYGFHHIGAQRECEPVRQVSRAAQLYAAEVRSVQRHGPYLLFGYSFGGLVAFELARELVAQGERIGLVILADCPVPGYPPPAPLLDRIRIHLQNLRAGSGRERAHYIEQRLANVRTRLAKLAGVIPHAAAQHHVPDHLRRLDAALYEAFIHYEPVALGVDVLFLTADTPPEWPTVSFDDPLLGWGPVLRGRISQCAIAGAHLSIFAPHNLPVLAARIRRGIERVDHANAAEHTPPEASYARAADATASTSRASHADHVTSANRAPELSASSAAGANCTTRVTSV